MKNWSGAGLRAGSEPIGIGPAAVVAFLIGLTYAVALLGPGFAFGATDYWYLPRAESGGVIDIRVLMSGYYWFAQDSWRWPLFHIAQANGAAGANAVLTDPVPILAAIAKLFNWAGGVPFNPYPLWTITSFALNATAFALLVRGMGQRSLLGAIVAGALGAAAPVVHFRFGHLSLMAHWIFILALAIYASTVPDRRAGARAALAMIALCVLAASTNLYIYVMTAGIAAAFALRAWTREQMSTAAAAAFTLGILGSGIVTTWGFGLLAHGEISGVTIPFGDDSMNLMAPWWPQTSGLFGWTGLYLLTRGSIGATKGQYEGYCYLGAGVLLLIGIALVVHARALPSLVRRHWPLAAALLVLTLWAVSNRIYLGLTLIVSYPLPDALLNTVLAWFRAEGRLFWPVAWTIAALGVAGTFSVARNRTALILAVVVLTLQWIDLSIWRDRIRTDVNAVPQSMFGTLTEARALEAEIKSRGRVAAFPSIMCNPVRGDYGAPDTIASVELQLMAARANAAMPSILLARNDTDCDGERMMPLANQAGSGLLVLFAASAPPERIQEAHDTLDCRPNPVGLVCTNRAAVAR